jgi:aminopeptidase N
MIPLLLLLQVQSPHDALHHDITLIPSDTGAHILGEVQTTWRLGSSKPVTMELDSAMRVIRVLVDGKPNTRISRTMYARSSTEVEVPHQKQSGDSMSTRVRYRGYPGGGLVVRRSARGQRIVQADHRPEGAHYWLPVPESPDDEATVALHIQVPVGYQVVADGALEKVDTLAYGQLMWHYNLNRPLPLYKVKVGWEGGTASSER